MSNGNDDYYDNDDYNYSYYDNYDTEDTEDTEDSEDTEETLSIEDQAADTLWSLDFEDAPQTLTMRDAEFAAQALREDGLLVAENDQKMFKQWGTATVLKDGSTTFTATSNRERAEREASKNKQSQVVYRHVTPWIVT